MEYFRIVLTSLLSLLALFLLTKMVGNKQMSELTMFDYINGITIGSIAAELATELQKPMRPLIAMTVYSLVSLTISVVTSKSLKLRRIIFGHTIVIIQNGKLLRKNLNKTHLDLNEFLMQCRSNGYFDISAINLAVLEPSGKISILPFPDRRPVTSQDLKVVPQADDVFFNVIMDGVILEQNLKQTGHDTNWLKNELNAQGCNNPGDIFLATLYKNGTLHIYKNSDDVQKNDFFE